VRHIFRKIAFTDFTDPQPNPAPRVDDSLQDVARSTSDGTSSSLLAQVDLALVGVWVRDGNGNASQDYVYERDRGHAPLPRHQPRFLFRVAGPGDPAIAAVDRVTVCWRLRARKGSTLRGVLELFVAGSPAAVWTRELSDAELRQEPLDVQPADRIQGTIFGGFEWDGALELADIDQAHQAAFAAGHLLASKSPYKLKLTIGTTKRRSRTSARQAWTYFDVPAWHKYKLAAYVPSTNLGCFGLEFDPEEPAVKVFSKVFTIAEQYDEAYQRSAAERRAEFAAACERAWGDQFELRRGGPVGRSWRGALRVEDVGGTTSQMDDKTLAGHEPAIADKIAAQRVHLCLVLKPKTGGSGLASAAKNPYANIFLFERSAFDTHHPGNVGRDVIIGELDVLHARLSVLFPPGGGGVATIANGPPTLEIPFAPGFVLGVAETAALQQVAAMVTACADTCAIPVYVTATGNPAGPLETQRANAVHGALQAHLPGGHPLVQESVDDPLHQRVVVRLGYRDVAERNALDQVPVAYNAAVHEFGHGFGLVDEYMDYGASQAFAGVAPGQLRMQALCQAHGVPAWHRPENRNGALMSVGSQVHKRYYLPLWEALAAVVGLKARRLDPRWSIIDRANNNPLPPPTESPDFDPLVRCLEAVEARARCNMPSSRKLYDALCAEIAAQGLADRVDYKRLVERDNPQQNVRPNRLAADQHCLVGLGVWRGNTLLHAATCVQVREVAPIIEVAKYLSRTNLGLTPPSFVLHPRPASKRHPVLLRSSHKLMGHGILTCDQDGVEVFRARHGGVRAYERQANPGGLRLTGAQLSRGIKVYVRGLTAVTQLSLALHSNGSPTRATAENARIELPAAPSLRVHPFSLVPGERPPALATVGIKTPELFVPLTPGPLGGLGGRCLVVVHRPAGTVGTLYLRVNPECSFHKAATGRKRVSKKVKRRINNGPKIEYQEVKLGRRDFDADGLRFLWLQGNAVSPATNTWKIALIDENDAEVAMCKVCVTAVHAVTVRLPATPALTPRVLPIANQPQDQEFQPAVAAGVLRDRDFTTNPPLVLIAGSAAPLRPPRVVVRVQPLAGKHMSLVLERAADDDARLRTGDVDPYPLELAQIGPDNGDGTQDVVFLLPGELVGSFHLRVRGGGSTLAVLNYVGVGAVAVLPQGQAKPKSRAVAQFAGQALAMQGGFLVAHTGSVPFPDPQHHDLDHLRAHACTRHVGRVRLTGGGPDGKRGLDRVFAGWIQNKTASQIEADYTDFRGGGVVHTARGEMVTNQGAARVLWERDRGFTLGGAVPVPLASPAPLLDTGRAADGGMTATLGGRKLERDDTVAFGQELVAVAVDSPGTEFPARHRSHDDALLTAARYDLTFRAYLCVWTDMSRGDAGGGTGDRLYGVVGHFQWKVEGTWTVNWPQHVQAFDNDDRRQNPDWWQTAGIAETRTFRAKRTRYHTYERARPAEGVVEVRPPTPLQVFAWNFL